ncbi:MAG: hemolysin III [Elusimicrobia bacterium RIFOXYA2_FULL_58_8]|nr:MAG: hemolysin III [Elusimicrobia bacterium RIFOXYA12_FULL_57_11]OGS16913.1 MAG: hemolysin III [Elusimicrobia bacterium RIFOXYA2_FULL_58_8]
MKSIYRDGEELFNSITHIVGAALALAGLVALAVAAGLHGDAWRIVSFIVYGVTLLLLYSFSALYHSLRGRAKRIFRILDHQAIYLLIAGTYTPFTLVTLRGAWGWWLFGIIWALAIFGIVLDSARHTGRRIVPLCIYLLMGWLITVALVPLLKALPAPGLGLLAAGGLFYTGGVYFYVKDDKAPYFHGVWHLFVLCGSLCHYFAVLFYV